jgi:hypothetical protein
MHVGVRDERRFEDWQVLISFQSTSPEPPKDEHPAQAADRGDALSSEGPQGNLDPTYDGPLPGVSVRPELSPEAVKTKLSIGSWN